MYINTDEEVWKDIPSYEGYYMVSNKGRVKSLPRNGTIRKERIIKQKDVNGYMTVHLRKSGYSKHRKVHRLVAKAFIEKNPGKEIVNHKDGVKGNNNVENLEWCTHSENTQHAFDTGLMEVDLEQLKVARRRSVKSTSKPVLQISSEGALVNEFSFIRQASLHMGVQSCNMIGDVCRGKRETYKGYKWEFAK